MQLHFLTHKKIIAFIVSLALFMDALDSTIINTAIPAMAQHFQVHPVDLKIALISYLLSLAIFIPISGWIADRFGVKAVFITALAIFTLSSLWCGYTQTIVELVIARSVQGLGAALMMPLGRLIILRNFQRYEIVATMNTVIMLVSVGLMIGPFAGGFITDQLSWHWIFWVNIPFGILAIVIAFFGLQDKVPIKIRPFDAIGFVLFGGGLAAMIYSLSDLSESTANHRISFILLFLAICMLIFYFFHARKQLYPIINMNLFNIRTFRISIIGNLFARLGFGGVPFLLPLLLQVSLGYSAQLSGLLLVPIAFGILLVKLFSLRVLRFLGFKYLLIINTIIVGLSLWIFCFINLHTSVFVIAAFTFLFGCLIALQYSGINSLAYAEISPEEHSSAISIASTVQQLSQSLGVAVSAIFLRYYSSLSSTNFALPPHVFHQTFFTMGWLTFLSTFIFIQLKPKDGSQMLTAPAQKKLTV